jgi:hypothetical protein
MQAPPVLEQKTRGNLEKEVEVFVQGGGEVIITDGALPICLTLEISFKLFFAFFLLVKRKAKTQFPRGLI